jgi:uncharacterized membrane protein YphA (DoxX/SURF4 family)
MSAKEEIAMNTALWIAQGALALIFVTSGVLKATQPMPTLIATGQTGVKFYPMPFIRFISACELLGAVGVIVPWLTGIARVLTPIAALGLAVIMIGAAASHSRIAHDEKSRRKKELLNVATNITIIAACAFVAAGRLRML